MSQPPGTALLGRLAVHLKMISLEQLAEATREQSKGDPPKRLGDILTDKGFITQKQLAKLVQAQQQVIAKQRSQAAEKAPASAAAPSPAPAPAAARASGDVELDRILREGIAKGASDVHFHSGVGVQLRVSGALVPLAGAPLEPAAAERMLISALPEAEAKILAEHFELDFCLEVAGVGRFRGNLYRQQRGLDAVFRYIPAEPPSLEQLGLPSTLARFTGYHQGLVLVTGPSGCGKSSTLAALVNLINEERREHILTIEDPVEYVHRSKRCLVNQRSVHRHTESFARALRAALREDPDVIVIGELRDLETISLALTAAETGHLVLATLHTDNAIRTINRVIGSYPSDAQGQVRTMLSESLRAVISQRLIPRADGKGRVAAIETLIVNKAVGNLIREDKTFQIQSILQTGASQGMALLDASIQQHVKSGAIARAEALRYCADP
ncbi:MAG: type IV pilus twitching motility protein PilT, partial [Candidatus Limnocylindria bacterium]